VEGDGDGIVWDTVLALVWRNWRTPRNALVTTGGRVKCKQEGLSSSDPAFVSSVHHAGWVQVRALQHWDYRQKTEELWSSKPQIWVRDRRP